MTHSQPCDKPEESLRPAFLMRKDCELQSPEGRVCSLTPSKEIGLAGTQLLGGGGGAGLVPG